MHCLHRTPVKKKVQEADGTALPVESTLSLQEVVDRELHSDSLLKLASSGANSLRFVLYPRIPWVPIAWASISLLASPVG